MAKDKTPKQTSYEKVAGSTKNITPYSKFQNDLLNHIGHDDFSMKLINLWKNRKDVDQLIWSCIWNKKRFWGLICAIPLLISVGVSTVFHLYPRLSYHIAEKVVNSKIPDLLPSETSVTKN